MPRSVVTCIESLPIGPDGATESGRRAAAIAAASLVSGVTGTSCDPSLFRLGTDPSGAPALIDSPEKCIPLHISITHTRTTAHGMAATTVHDD